MPWFMFKQKQTVTIVWEQEKDRPHEFSHDYHTPSQKLSTDNIARLNLCLPIAQSLWVWIALHKTLGNHIYIYGELEK